MSESDSIRASETHRILHVHCLYSYALNGTGLYCRPLHTAAAEGVGKFNLKNRIQPLGFSSPESTIWGSRKELEFSQIQKWFGRCGRAWIKASDTQRILHVKMFVDRLTENVCTDMHIDMGIDHGWACICTFVKDIRIGRSAGTYVDMFVNMCAGICVRMNS